MINAFYEDGRPGEQLVHTVPSRIAAAFTEWERRYREEPERFQSENERLATEVQTQGQLQAAYLVQLLTEQKRA